MPLQPPNPEFLASAPGPASEPEVEIQDEKSQDEKGQGDRKIGPIGHGWERTTTTTTTVATAAVAATALVALAMVAGLLQLTD